MSRLKPEAIKENLTKMLQEVDAVSAEYQLLMACDLAMLLDSASCTDEGDSPFFELFDVYLLGCRKARMRSAQEKAPGDFFKVVSARPSPVEVLVRQVVTYLRHDAVVVEEVAESTCSC